MRSSFSNTKNRWKSASAEDLFNEIANDFGHRDCERRIENLLKILPITTLRDDLTKFYDERVFGMQRVCETMHGGVGRCVVEFVPRPIRYLDNNGDCRITGEPIRGQHPPIAPNSFVILAAAEKMKSLINDEVPGLMGRDDGRLYGMSLFYQNRLVLSKVVEKVTQTFPPEISYAVIEYFRTSRGQEKDIESTQKEKVTQNENQVAPLSRWFTGTTKGEEAEESVPFNGNNESQTDNDTGFLVHPTPKMGKERPTNSLYLCSMKKHVWIQRIHLPSTLGFDSTDHEDEVETYAVLHENNELSFLLFFEVTNLKGKDGVLATMAEELQPRSNKVENFSNSTNAFKDVLIFLDEQLSEFCTTFSSHDDEEDPMSNSKNMAPVKEIDSDKIFPGEPGMDIICIDRDEGSFVLLSQHDLSSNEFKRIGSKSDNDTPSNGSKKSVGWFGGATKPKSSSEHKSSHRSQHSSMMDCRHKLASYLPVAILLAFDDMFIEIGKHRKEDATAKSIELCTFLSQGWVYSRAFRNVELYILLDTSKFVTISDVQKAVTRVRERLFNDKIR